MFKLIYVPKHLRGYNYKEILNRQLEGLAKVDRVMEEAQQVHVANCEIQAALLQTLGNLNNCSEEDLKEMQLMTENYMKIAINKNKGEMLNV